MKCQQCQTQLSPQARFCPHCGTSVQTQEPIVKEEDAPVTSEHHTQELPTQPIYTASISHPELIETTEQQPVKPQTTLSPLQQSSPLLYYKLNTTTKGFQMLPAVINSASARGESQRRRRGKGGCILGCLTTLILLLVILGAGWIFLLRPYAHNIAQTELDKAMTSAVDQMPTNQLIKLLPSGSTLPINESTINNLIVLNVAPSSPVQSPQTTITPQQVRIAFQVYGYPSAISMQPTLDNNGRLVASNVNVEGVLGLIMSPDELKPLLDKHFSDAQNKLGRTIKAVKLDNQQLSITI